MEVINRECDELKGINGWMGDCEGRSGLPGSNLIKTSNICLNMCIYRSITKHTHKLYSILSIYIERGLYINIYYYMKGELFSQSLSLYKYIEVSG